MVYFIHDKSIILLWKLIFNFNVFANEFMVHIKSLLFINLFNFKDA